MHHWSPTERGIPRGDLMHTVTTSREGLLRFGFSEQEKPQWQKKLRVTIPKIQTDYRRSFSYLVKYLEMKENAGKADSPERTAGTFLFHQEKELLLVSSKPR